MSSTMSYRVKEYRSLVEYKSWQAEMRQRVRILPFAGEHAKNAPGPQPQAEGRNVAAGATHASAYRGARVIGKQCFSCHSLSAVSHRFCDECGAPLFRPSA